MSMRRHLVRLSAGVLLGQLWAPGAAWALERGELAPVLQLAGLNGRSLSVPDRQSRVTYVDFWASWCGPCRQSFPFMNDLQARYGAKGLRVVAVNLDAKPADAERFLAQVPAQFEVLLDASGESARRYGVRGMPSSALLGPDGRVLMWHQGFKAEDRAHLESAIKQALGNAP